ncbi:hypothetical protein ACHAXR_005079 [Thalassiosira sp. AJA248-18]
MDVADEYGCGERITVNLNEKEYSFPHYSCILGQCGNCDSVDYAAPKFEVTRANDTIRYSKFTSHTQCSIHQGANIQYHDSKPKIRCGVCEDLEDEEKTKAKIVKRLFRTIHTESLLSFIKKRGTYAKELRKMLSHKYRVRLLGRDFKKFTRYEHANRRRNTLKLERDFTERFGPKPNNQAQHEYFQKDESLGIEGITVYFKPKGKEDNETHFIAVMSTEKQQDGNVVYTNTPIMLDDIKEMLDNGAEIFGIVPTPTANLLEILEDTDGCSVQYRCANSLFMVHKLAAELNIVYDRAIDAEGHGKKSIDGYLGSDKTFMEHQFRTNVEYQPEAVNPLRKSVLFSQMEDGRRRDLADLCHEILARAERSNGSVPKVEPKKPRKAAPTKKKTALSRRKYIVRKKGVAKWSKIRMAAIGFPKTKGNGMKFHYNFRFEKALERWFSFRRIPCSCDGCYEKLCEPIETRYTGACNTCVLWKIFEKKDGSGTGLNDWNKAKFEPADDCDDAVYHACKADTLREMGKTWTTQVVEGHVGAYRVDDRRYNNYYLVKWEGEPVMALETEALELGGNTFTVNKGDWYCEGEWLDKLKGVRGWWALTG